LVSRFMEEYERLYEDSRRVVERLQEIGFQPPRELRLAAEMTVSRRLERELREQRRGAGDYRTALEIAREAARFGFPLDRAPVTRVFEQTVNDAARSVVLRPTTENIRSARTLIELGRELGLEANLERAQEIIYETAQAGGPLNEKASAFTLALCLMTVTIAATRRQQE